MRFTKTMRGRYYTQGESHSYTVISDGPAWLLVICDLETVAGIQVSSEDVLKQDFHDTAALAKATAQAFEALGDSYLQSEHGGHSRYTQAIQDAYDDAAA